MLHDDMHLDHPGCLLKYKLQDPFSDLRTTVLGEPRNLGFKMQLQMNLEFEVHLLWAMHMWSHE